VLLGMGDCQGWIQTLVAGLLIYSLNVIYAEILSGDPSIISYG
jgi:hypothetical protein